MKTTILTDAFIGQLETLAFHMGIPMRGFFGGMHRTRSYGQTVEFADFREYVLGDDLRHIDWNLFSRFEKHFIKLFVDERQMHTHIYLDCSASMGKTNPHKSTFALKVAAAIGYLSVLSMDRLSFRLIKENHLDDLSGTISTRNAFFQALTQLEKIQFKKDANINHAVLSALNVGKDDGLSVIISDFLTDNWKKAVDFLLYQKREVMLIHVLSPEEVNPFYMGRMQLLDAESSSPIDEKNLKLRITKGHFKAYEQALADFKESIKNFATKRGVHYIFVQSDEKVERFVFQKLAQVGTVK